jgi:steroid delta-isomerase-like uncharacterized protein
MATETKPTAQQAKPRRRVSKRKATELVARSYFDALAASDPSAIASHWREDGVVDIVPVGVMRGPGEIEGFFREAFAAIPDAETTVTRLVAGDGQAAVEWRLVGRFTGLPFQGIEATGRRLELRGLDLLEIEDGKIVSNTAYYDGMAFARQVGMMPPMDSGSERAVKSAFNAVTRLRRAVNDRIGS